MSDATLIDLADPHVPPVTVNPFEPEPGCPVQAHADRLAALLEAAFGLPGPVAAAVRAGLARAYVDCGWDVLTGTTAPGARTAPAVPAFAQLARAALGAAEDLGYDRRMRAAVRGFVQARLEPLWTGPAGRFLEGGHPADVGCLIRGHVLVTVGGVADDAGTFFLAGALLARIADRLRAQDRRDPAPARRPAGPARPRPAPRAGRTVRRPAGAPTAGHRKPGGAAGPAAGRGDGRRSDAGGGGPAPGRCPAGPAAR